MSLYNPNDMVAHVQARARDVNRELGKIKDAFDEVEQALGDGAGGGARYTWTAYANSPDGAVDFTTGAPGARAYMGQAFNRLVIEPSSTADDYEWKRFRGFDGATGDDGEDGIDGADGKLVEFVWQRASEKPDAPTGNGVPLGWYDDPPSGSNPLWMSKSKQELDGTLIGAWSDPIRHDGPPGTPGTDGLPGNDGVDGTSLYTWIAYADSADGVVNFTTSAPSGRAYIGTAYNQGSPVESNNRLDYAWSPYSGPPNFGLVAGTNAAVAGAKIIKTGGALDWNAQVYSSESYLNGALTSFRWEGGSVMVGLNSDPTTDASYSSIDYAIYVRAENMTSVYNNGSEVWSGGINSAAAGDSFAIQHTGNQVIYTRNGQQIYSQAGTQGQRWWLDSSVYNIGHVATITAWASAGIDGNDGDPGPAGPEGVTSLSASVLPSAITVAATYNGTPKSGIPGFTVKCFQGTANVTTAAMGSITAVGVSGVSHIGSGNFTVSGMGGDTGYVEIPFSYGGASTLLRVSYAKAKDGAAYVTGRANVNSPTATSYSEVSRVTLLMGPTGQIDVDANGAFGLSGGGSISIEAYFEYSLNGGGSFSSLGGSWAITPYIAGEQGDFSGGAVVSGASIGLYSSQTVIIRAMMRKTNGNSFFNFSGSMAVQWAGS